MDSALVDFVSQNIERFCHSVQEGQRTSEMTKPMAPQEANQEESSGALMGPVSAFAYFDFRAGQSAMANIAPAL